MLELLIAHGVGSRGTLPLPWWQFAWAAIVALGLSFVGLGSFWRTPRLTADAPRRVVEGTAVPLTIAEWVLRVVGILIYGVTLGAGLFGTDIGGESVNLAPVTIYVMVWVAVPIFAAVFGDFWKALNPFETIGKLFPEQRREAPDHHWVAGALLFGFLVLELVHPSGDSPRILGWGMVVYSIVMIGGMAVYGRVWLERADGLALLFRTIAAIAPFGRNEAGNLVLRRPMSELSNLRVRPGTAIAFLIVLGGTSFDGFSESPLFTDIIGRPRGWAAFPPLFIGLIIMIGIAAILFWIGSQATAKVTGLSHVEASDLFAPSLLPIVWAYAVAHYAQLLVDQSQSFWFRLSNPYGAFDANDNPTTNLFGAADGVVNLNVIDVNIIAWVQAISIVVGHVLAVLYAHDLAIRGFEHRSAVRSQQTMLFVMVMYSVAGLWLLFSA